MKEYTLSRFEWRVGQSLGYTNQNEFAELVYWAETHGFNADWSEFSDAEFAAWHADVVAAKVGA